MGMRPFAMTAMGSKREKETLTEKGPLAVFFPIARKNLQSLLITGSGLKGNG